MGQKILQEAKLQRREIEREEEEKAGVSRRGESSYSVKTAISKAAKKYDDSDSEEAQEGYLEDYEYEVTAESEPS